MRIDFADRARYPLRMGRPPLNMKQTNIRLSADVQKRIEALVSNRGMAKFIREAIDEKLERDEAAKRDD